MPQTLQRPTAFLSSSFEAGPLLRQLTEAKDETRNRVSANQLALTVTAMLDVADGYRSTAVYGASDVGHALAGAMALGGVGLSLWLPPSSARVLLVDGVVASLAGLTTAAQRIRAMGAENVDAMVLGLRGSSECDGMDRVTILDRQMAMVA